MAPLPFFIDPRILDPRLWLRAFEDLHTLSEAAVLALDDLHRVAQVAEGLEDIEARLTARVDVAQKTLEEAVETARGLLGMQQHAAELLDAAQVMNAAATTLAAAVEPLQGMLERLGAVADRLPGGGRRARSAKS